jgi:hypothetical protein
MMDDDEFGAVDGKWRRKPKYSEKTCPSTVLSTKYSTWPDLGWNTGRYGGKPATNRMGYGKAFLKHIYKKYVTLSDMHR